MTLNTLLVALLLAMIGLTEGFNLEPRIAVVKEGRKGSYFGYSVSQHQVLGRNSLEAVALVGAPVDNSGQPGTNRTGLLWRCPLTQSRSDCSPVRGAVPGSRKPPGRHETRDGQWLGVAVASQGPGKKVIVCAHRYQRRGPDFNWGQGQCYTLTQNLNHDETWEPCSGRDKSRAHEQWGYCQAGTSAILVGDDTALIGTPGPYTWRGTVFAMSTSADFLFRDKTHYHTPVLPSDSPVDKYSYLGMAVAAGNFLPTSRNCGEYLSYAAGAPRANGTGQVVIFVKCHSELMKVQMILSGGSFASQFGYSLASMDVNNDGYSDLFVGAPFFNDMAKAAGAVYVFMNGVGGLNAKSRPLILRGSTEESRFGFAVSSAGDVNNDGYQDLVVGAPYDGRGAVFLYQGGPNGIKTKPSQVVKAEEMPGKRLETFGYALSGGMDMDLNNHSDVLVGAYASDAIVILRARPVIDIVTWFGNKTVRINPTVSGCDKDPTSPEVCFQIESCFRIRNFPSNIETTNVRYKIVAEVFNGGKKISRVRFESSDGEITHTNEKIVQVRKNNLDGCFEELVYLKEGTTDIKSPIKFHIEYSLGLDEPTIQGGLIPNINQFPILNQNEANKELEIPFHKDCGDDDECQSFLTSKVHLFKEDSTELDTDTLELEEGSEILLNVTVSNTGDPAYASWLTVNFSSIFSYVGRSDEVKDIECNLENEIAILCNLGNPFLKREEVLQFRLVPLYSTEIPPDVHFLTNVSTTSENLATQNFKARTFIVKRRAEVSIRGSVRPESILYGGQVVGESGIRDIAEIGSRVLHTFHVVNDGPWRVDTMTVNIDWPYQVESGKPQGKWLLYLTHPVELSPPGIGQCYMNPRYINFLGLRQRREKLPEKQESDTSISGAETSLSYSSLSGTKPSSSSSSYSSSSSSSSYFSSFSGKSRTSHKTVISNSDNDIASSRIRRDLESVIEADNVLTSGGSVSRMVVFDCGRATAKCFTITCSLTNLARRDNAVIKLRSRVWNSTLVEDYPHIDSVIINARANIELPRQLAGQQSRGDDETTVSVVAYPDGLSDGGVGGVPLWIMIVAIVAGLLLVGCITLILWKFGFFKRKRVSDVTISAKVSKTSPLLRGDEYIS